MKIVIFTENNRGGGMDTFIGSLINNWPEKNDTFIVICNESHPGLTYLEGLLPKNIRLVKHSIKLNPLIGSPPIPIHVDCPRPISEVC